jgi:hypothetical protein
MYDIYATHAPILAQALMQTDGPVFEFGAGWGSTPLLHALCRWRKLTTYETNVEWLQKFLPLKNTYHELLPMHDWQKFMDENPNLRMSLALVDCQPGEMRAPLIRWLRDKCTYVVVHDTETDYATGADYKYEPEFKLYKYRADYRFMRPYTTVVSDDFIFWMDSAERIWTPSADQKAYFDEKGIKP